VPDYLATSRRRSRGIYQEIEPILFLLTATLYRENLPVIIAKHNQPDTFIEVNLAQMLAYSIYRGISAGLVETRYLSLADRMREAILDHVDGYGFVQDVCGAPNFDRPGNAVEGQAFFLLMESARSNLCKLQSP
jgi:hypothetical protein